MSYLVKRTNVDSEIIDKVMNENGLSRDIAEILCMRGLTQTDQIAKFLHPNIEDLTPVFSYTGMKEASDRIKQAVAYGESIVIYGDYDCDGVCATSILYMFLKSLGVEVNFYIPHRKREGYGLHRESIEDIAEQYAPDLIITVDCGITSYEDIEYGTNELGLEFIVTDHHEAPEVIPDCVVIDPKVEWKEDTFNELCGAGIALRLCEAVGGTGALMYYMDIAAIATIGDIVPLVEDNRIIVNYGMQILNSRARMNTKLLLEIAGLPEDGVVTSGDVAFKIVPRINAIGRLSDPTKAVIMMVDSDYFYTKHLVENANDYNQERQQFTDDLVADALIKLEDYDLVNNKVIVLYDEKWEAGVLGIACSKLVTLFHRPTILMTSADDKIYKGSCRSIDRVNMYECLSATSTFLNGFGGHKMACGLSVLKENVESFIFAINEFVRTKSKSIFLPYQVYDLEREPGDITLDTAEQLKTLEPFGMANPQVTYRIVGEGKKFERINTTSHIKCKGNEDFDMVYFDGYSKLPIMHNTTNISMLTELSERIFNNRKYVQGLVRGVDYAPQDYIADKEYLAIKYVYNARYDNESVFDVDYIPEDKVADISSELYGTIYIASNIDTFNRYREILRDKLVREDIRHISEINPYNRLILDMDISENLVYYRNIVFLDMPISLGVIDYLKLNRQAKIYAVADSLDSEALALVAKHFPDIPRMREIFVEVKTLLKKYKLTNLAELYDKYQKEGSGNIIEYYIAMFVFIELKIIKVRGVMIVDNTVKTSLDNSVCYTKIKEVVNG